MPRRTAGATPPADGNARPRRGVGAERVVVRPHRGPARAPVRPRRFQYVGGDGRAARDGGGPRRHRVDGGVGDQRLHRGAGRRDRDPRPPGRHARHPAAAVCGRGDDGRRRGGRRAGSVVPGADGCAGAAGHRRRRGPCAGHALVSARWSGAEQASALGRIAGVAATLSAFGPLAGGALEAAGGWRWSVALPVVGTLALPLLRRAAPAEGSGERIDLPGAVFVAMAATGLVLLIQSPSAGVVTAAVCAVLLVLGVAAVAARVRARPYGFLPREIITNGTVLRSAFATAAVPASWFALLLGVPLAAASWGWTPLATGLLLVPSAVIGFVSPRIARALIGRLGPRRAIAVACPTAVVALLVAALGGAVESPVLLAAAVALVTVAFGVGQPAMIASVSGAVSPARRGVALGVATLVFLTGASVGAALVGGLAEIVGVPGAFCLLVALPVAGVATLLI